MKLAAGLLRPGDWLVLALGAAVAAATIPVVLRAGPAEKAVIRAAGQVYAEYPLSDRRRVEVPGALGTTVIEIEPGRARVVSDPGPRQYCVRQGWLVRADSIAVCAPSQVSLELTGRQRRHDSISY